LYEENSIVYCLFNFCQQSAAYATCVHKKPDLTQMKQEFKYLRAVYVKLCHIFCTKT